MAPSKQYNDRGDLGRRYRRSVRTVDRMVASGTLPPPDRYLNKRPLWSDELLDNHDRQAVLEHAAAKGLTANPTAEHDDREPPAAA